VRLLATGIDYSTGEPLVEPMDEAVFGERLRAALDRNADELREQASRTSQAAIFKAEIEAEPAIDLRDPRAAGWTFLVGADDPDRDDIIDVLRPLAEHRGMANPGSPLLFDGDDWFEWFLVNYTSLEVNQLPHYVLIVGGPDKVPFHFQAFLDTAAAVGRIDLPLEGLKAYVDKVRRLELAEDPVPTRQALFFAPDAGRRRDGSFDATYFSRRYLVPPLIKRVREDRGFEIRELLGDEAERAALVAALGEATAALVFTASHGLGAPDQPLEVQQRVNGAICCQRTGSERSMADWLFMGEHVPAEQPFLEGAVFFQFACFGYGTPAESDFMHWLGGVKLNGQADFVAALPKRLLAHPRGPIAFIGHVDTAWLHGFDDPDSPHLIEPYDARLAPFAQALNKLLRVEPVGRVLEDMNQRYSVTNAMLTGAWDRLRRGRAQPTPEFWRGVASTFITRSDAQNYLIFGDPAARLRISDD
jgi:hypothetical protein